MDIDKYREDFITAFDVARNWGFEVDSPNSRLVGQEALHELFMLHQMGMMDWGPEASALQCAAIHETNRQLLLQRYDGVNPVLTIGWLEMDGQSFYETTWGTLKRQIKREKRRGPKRQSVSSINLHVWLTVQNDDEFQLLDFTFPSYLVTKGIFDDPQPWLIHSDHPASQHERVDYHPLVVGREVLEVLGYLGPLDQLPSF